jgi:prefoldin alpha subunit
MSKHSAEKINEVINENLRKELESLQIALNKINEDLIEYMQLQKTLEFLKEHKSDGFKTKVDVGANMFMKAKVEKIEPIIINIGLNVYLELEMDEAMKFLSMKIKVLEKEAEVVREQSLKVRCQIKILLMYLAEQQQKPKSNLVK